MNSDKCTKLISETLNLVGQARDAKQGPWECAYIARLTSLNRMKERILTREAREAAQAKGPTGSASERTDMKTTIEVKDRNEGNAIKRGLDDPTVRAFTVMMGILAELPSVKARARVLQFVKESFDEQDQGPPP